MKKLLITGLLALSMAGSAVAFGVAPAEAAGIHVTINPGYSYGYHHIVRHHHHRLHKVTTCKRVWRHHHRVRICRTVWR